MPLVQGVLLTLLLLWECVLVVWVESRQTINLLTEYIKTVILESQSWWSAGRYISPHPKGGKSWVWSSLRCIIQNGRWSSFSSSTVLLTDTCIASSKCYVFLSVESSLHAFLWILIISYVQNSPINNYYFQIMNVSWQWLLPVSWQVITCFFWVQSAQKHPFCP